MPVVPWRSGNALVGFANVDSTFLDSGEHARGPGSALSRRAAAVLPDESILVAYEPSCRVPGLARPTEVAVERRSGDLCADVLDDGRAFDELRRQVETVPRPWQLWAQTYTPAMDLLSLELERHGFDRTLLPACAGVTVAFWNSKVGGDDLLRHAASDRYPHTWVHESVDTLVGRPLASHAAVVKPNRSMGGYGVVVVEGGDILDPLALEMLADPPGDSPEPGKAKLLGKTGESVVIQEVIGDMATNRSPSADFWVDVDGTTTMVALAEQVLNRARYAGSRSWSPRDRATRAMADTIGNDVGRELHREGYRGFFNLDFAATSDGDFAVLEINVRQSAPLDQTITMERRFGPEWRDTMSFEAREGRAELHGDEVLRYEVDDRDEVLTLAVTAGSPR